MFTRSLVTTLNSSAFQTCFRVYSRYTFTTFPIAALNTTHSCVSHHFDDHCEKMTQFSLSLSLCRPVGMLIQANPITITFVWPTWPTRGALPPPHPPRTHPQTLAAGGISLACNMCRPLIIRIIITKTYFSTAFLILTRTTHPVSAGTNLPIHDYANANISHHTHLRICVPK